MTWPPPQPGLVIRYAYLWRREALEGREEAVKDRPCAILLLVKQDEHASPLVWVLPITHAHPIDLDAAVEIPQATKRRLGLDGERSWIILSEANEFRWPGPDLRPAVRGDPASVAYGMLPPRLFELLRAQWLELFRARRAQSIKRTE